MKCRLCRNLVVEGKNSIIEDGFAVHLDCGMGEGKTPRKGKRPEQSKTKKNKKNPFIASPNIKGWRDIK